MQVWQGPNHPNPKNTRRPIIARKALLKDLIANHLKQENGLNNVLVLALYVR